MHKLPNKDKVAYFPRPLGSSDRSAVVLAGGRSSLPASHQITVGGGTDRALAALILAAELPGISVVHNKGVSAP